MPRQRFVFIVEQGLGHVVHGMNLAATLDADADVDATVVGVRPRDRSTPGRVPLLDNWSVQTSWATRDALRATLDQRMPDAVFIHTQVAALFAGKVMRTVPTVVSLDATPLNFDSMAEAYGHARQSEGIEWVKRKITSRALSMAAAVVTWSQWAARSVVDDYGVAPERVHAIYPGVDLGRFGAKSDRKRGEPVRILFVGGDLVRKGGEDLLAAAATLDHPLEIDLVTSTEDVRVPSGLVVRVHRGVRPNSDELARLYLASDIFALPSRGDCTPLAIAEAMATGLPVIASTVGSIPEMVRHGYNGLLVPPAQPHSIAESLLRLLTDEDLRQRMGRASRVLAEAEHDTAANGRRIVALMRSLTRTGP